MAPKKNVASQDEEIDFASPQARLNFVGDEAWLAQYETMAKAGDLTNGWLIIGGEGAGKATLAYRLARLLLRRGNAADGSIGQAGTDQTENLIAARAHPDLFVAARTFDEKTGRFSNDISVDVIRQLTQFLTRTPSYGQWRVAIVDTADDLNRNAANALLKALEEPPARTTLFLLSSAPGRLLATIRSRCRRMTLPLVDETLIAQFITGEGAVEETDNVSARTLAGAAKGRPGFALTLASGEGGVAAEEAAQFLKRAKENDLARPLQRLCGRQSDATWSLFRRLLTDQLNDYVREEVVRGGYEVPLQLLDMRDDVISLLARGDALNLDRAHLIQAAARRIRRLPTTR